MLLTLAVIAALASSATAFELPAVKADPPPVIDGWVAEDEWAAASRAGDFIQFEPHCGKPSPVRTQAFVLYDERNLYVAFRAYDHDAVTAQLTQRDADLFTDDSIVVILDSSHDHQSAFYFMTNALGTQADGRIGDDGRVRDTSWDAPWTSAARVTLDGWSAEVRIPLASIKYAAGDKVTWGLNLGGSRRRSLEVSFWAGPLENRDQVSQAGTLVGLTVPRPHDRLQVVPYGLSQLQEGDPGSWQAGVDVRYAITSELAGYATLNPDFATVEADREQVNLTRFEISLPEKRQFFLEGQELFQQRIRTFYSRRIADIVAGVKAFGRIGAWTTAILTTQSDPLDDAGRANFTVARAQRDVLGRSYVALMLANRHLEGLSQGSLELDTNLFFTKSIGITGQLVQSYGTFDRGTLAFFVRPAYDSPTGHFHVRSTHLGDRFKENVNVIGFVVDDDRRELDSAMEKTLWREGGTLERLAYESNYNIYWSQSGTLRSWEIRQSVEADLRNRFSARATYIEEFKRFEKDFRNRQVGFGLGYNTREYQSLQLGLRFGRNFDSDFRLWTATARHKLGEQFSVEYELERLTLDPDPELQSSWIHVMRATQSFTKDLYLRVFFQSNSAIDRKNLQAVFVWRYKPPFGTVQVAFQRGTAGFGERSEQGNTLFLKLTTVF